jgi:hypothetical protein
MLSFGQMAHQTINLILIVNLRIIDEHCVVHKIKIDVLDPMSKV